MPEPPAATAIVLRQQVVTGGCATADYALDTPRLPGAGKTQVRRGQYCRSRGRQRGVRGPLHEVHR